MQLHLRSVLSGVMILALGHANSQSLRSEPSSEQVRLHATLLDRTIQLMPSKVEFQIPKAWLKWNAKHKNNIHLGQKALLRVREGTGEWDQKYGEVVNAVLPFSKCAAHMGEEGWGEEGVSHGDLQFRAYVVETPPEEVVAKLLKEGAARASTFSKSVSSSRSRHGEWHRGSVNYRLFFGDYGGQANVDLYAQRFAEQTVVLVFMFEDANNQNESRQEILESFTWKGAK